MPRPLLSPPEAPHLRKFIYTNTLSRGSGRDPYDPVRIVPQVFLPDGTLLMEDDPYRQLDLEDVRRALDAHTLNEPVLQQVMQHLAELVRQRRNGTAG